MVLSDRDQQILVALCTKVRLMTHAQICGHWWAQARSSQTSAEPCLSRLTKRGLLTRFRVLMRPLPCFTEPVVSWQSGQQPANPHAVSWRLKRRWRHGSAFTTAYSATRQARLLFGGGGDGHLSHPIQATHDAGLAGVYLQFLAHRPHQARAWLGEDCLALGNRQKNPDAQIVDAHGNVLLVIEFGGSYGPGRVAAFHQFCRKRGFPYELW